jgi:hypothetical protein
MKLLLTFLMSACLASLVIVSIDNDLFAENANVEDQKEVSIVHN